MGDGKIGMASAVMGRFGKGLADSWPEELPYFPRRRSSVRRGRRVVEFLIDDVENCRAAKGASHPVQ